MASLILVGVFAIIGTALIVILVFRLNRNDRPRQ